MFCNLVIFNIAPCFNVMFTDTQIPQTTPFSLGNRDCIARLMVPVLLRGIVAELVSQYEVFENGRKGVTLLRKL